MSTFHHGEAVEEFLRLLNDRRPLIMGILNVTPDSFSDGGRYVDQKVAAQHALEMLDQHAAIVDIGGESTRPPGLAYGIGASAVSADEELARVLPVIEEILRQRPSALLSIDTRKSEVARAAIAAGVAVINDVSAGTADSDMFEVAAERDTPIILMHGHGPRFTLPSVDDYQYSDVVHEVFDYLRERISKAQSTGVKHIMADIGFGFGKGYRDNLALLRRHLDFLKLGVPLVLGVSRKATIGKITGEAKPENRISGSVAGACYGVIHGAKIMRVHDVRPTYQAFQFLEAIEHLDATEDL